MTTICDKCRWSSRSQVLGLYKCGNPKMRSTSLDYTTGRTVLVGTDLCTFLNDGNCKGYEATPDTSLSTAMGFVLGMATVIALLYAMYHHVVMPVVAWVCWFATPLTIAISTMVDGYSYLFG